MKSINPKDYSEVEVSTIEYITLKNGNIIILDNTIPEKKNKINKCTLDKMKSNFLISNHINFSFTLDKKNNKELKDNGILIYNKKDLQELKKEIDIIDKKIIDLYFERLKLMKYINEYKEEKNFKLFDYNNLNEKILSKKEIQKDEFIDNNYLENIFSFMKNLNKMNTNSSEEKKDSFYEKPPKIPFLKNKNLNTIDNSFYKDKAKTKITKNAKTQRTQRNSNKTISLDNSRSMKSKNCISSVTSINIQSEKPTKKNCLISKFNKLVDKLNIQKYSSMNKDKIKSKDKKDSNKIYYKDCQRKKRNFFRQIFYNNIQFLDLKDSNVNVSKINNYKNINNKNRRNNPSMILPSNKLCFNNLL